MSSRTKNARGLPNILTKRKIAVLGARSVGKSALVIQFVENRFVENYHATIETTYEKSIALKRNEFECDIIDTAGQDEFSILNSKYAIGIHGYILVYSVTSRKSFEMIKIIFDKIVDFIGEEDVPCVIVGAKIDIQRRQVSSKDGEKVAQELGCSYVETSARSRINVVKVFESCLQEIELRNPTTPPKPPCCIS